MYVCTYIIYQYAYKLVCTVPGDGQIPGSSYGIDKITYIAK